MVALLEKLKSAVEDFAAKEEKLNHDFQVQTAAQAKAFEAASKDQALQHDEGLARAEADFASQKEKCRAAFDRRKRRINEAHKTLRRQAMDGVSTQEGRRKHKLQEGAIRAERRRDADLANAAARLEEFRQRLAQSGEALARLEKSARKAFRGFGKFRRLLSLKRKWPEPDLSPGEDKLFEEWREVEAQTAAALKRLRMNPLWWLKRFLPPVWLLLILGVLRFVLPPNLLPQSALVTGPFPTKFDLVLLGLMVFRIVIYLSSKQIVAAAAHTIASDLAKARRFHEACY
ncbi:MAG: hypothetical protein DME25_13485, partial [Verrucomicrobia bacterium]